MDPDFSKWHSANKNNLLYTANENYRINSCFIFSPGASMKQSLMRFRSLFIMPRKQSGDNTEGERLKIETFFNMEYSQWINTMLCNHFADAKNRAELEKNPEMMQDFKAYFIENIIVPYKSVQDFIKEAQLQKVAAIQNNTPATAQHRDMYYANLVHGACVKVPISEIWCPNDEMEHSDKDTESFFKAMWKGLRGTLSNAMNYGGGKDMARYTDSLIKSIRDVKDAKRHMKQIWEESKSYRVSDRVHMTEVQILQRLKADGVFRWIDDPDMCLKDGPQHLHLCFYMRR
jgi:hypothetical protein